MLMDTNIARMHDELYALFDAYNAEFFHGALSRPVIGLEKAEERASRSWTSRKKTWAQTGSRANLGEFYEITIATEDVGQQTENIAAMLLHEMCHLYAIENGIKDTSENRFYHNEAFRNIAESHGLVVAKEPRYGFSVTSLSPDAFIVASNVFNAVSPVFHIPKRDENTSSGRKPSSTRKFKCPSCGMKIRVTKAGSVNVICGDCGAKFVEFD